MTSRLLVPAGDFTAGFRVTEDPCPVLVAQFSPDGTERRWHAVLQDLEDTRRTLSDTSEQLREQLIRNAELETQVRRR